MPPAPIWLEKIKGADGSDKATSSSLTLLFEGEPIRMRHSCCMSGPEGCRSVTHFALHIDKEILSHYWKDQYQY